MFKDRKVFKEIKANENSVEARLNKLETAARSQVNAVIQTAALFDNDVTEGTTTTTNDLRTENIPTYAKGLFMIVDRYSGSAPFTLYFRKSGTDRTDFDPHIYTHLDAAESDFIMVELSSDGKIDMDVVSGTPGHVVTVTLFAVGYWT